MLGSAYETGLFWEFCRVVNEPLFDASIVTRGTRTTRNAPHTAEKTVVSLGFQLSGNPSSYEGQIQDQLLRCR